MQVGGGTLNTEQHWGATVAKKERKSEQRLQRKSAQQVRFIPDDQADCKIVPINEKNHLPSRKKKNLLEKIDRCPVT